MSPELPRWVYDAVMAMQRWALVHPLLFQSGPGIDDFERTNACGCEALAFVPDEVKTQAAAISAYLASSTPVDSPVEGSSHG